MGQTFRNITYYNDNPLNRRISGSNTGTTDTAINATSNPNEQIVSFDDFPRTGKILMRVAPIVNNVESGNSAYIPNITALRSGGNANADVNITSPTSSLSLGASKIALIRTYNHADLIVTDELNCTVNDVNDTLTITNGRVFTNGELIYFTTNTSSVPAGLSNTLIYTVFNASVNTCELLAHTSYTKVNIVNAGVGLKVRIFNTINQSLDPIRIGSTADTIDSFRATAIGANNEIISLLSQTALIYLTGTNAESTILGSNTYQNVKEFTRYKISNFTDASSPTADSFKINNIESTTARTFSTNVGFALLANLGVNFTKVNIKIRHLQRLGGIPQGGVRQVTNEITKITVDLLPTFVWFELSFDDALDGDYRYNLEWNSSMDELELNNLVNVEGNIIQTNNIGDNR